MLTIPAWTWVVCKPATRRTTVGRTPRQAAVTWRTWWRASPTRSGGWSRYSRETCVVGSCKATDRRMRRRIVRRRFRRIEQRCAIACRSRHRSRSSLPVPLRPSYCPTRSRSWRWMRARITKTGHLCRSPFFCKIKMVKMANVVNLYRLHRFTHFQKSQTEWRLRTLFFLISLIFATRLREFFLKPIWTSPFSIVYSSGWVYYSSPAHQVQIKLFVSINCIRTSWCWEHINN